MNIIFFKCNKLKICYFIKKKYYSAKFFNYCSNLKKKKADATICKQLQRHTTVKNWHSNQIQSSFFLVVEKKYQILIIIFIQWIKQTVVSFSDWFIKACSSVQFSSVHSMSSVSSQTPRLYYWCRRKDLLF